MSLPEFGLRWASDPKRRVAGACKKGSLRLTDRRRGEYASSMWSAALLSLVTLAVGIYFTAVSASADNPQRQLIFGASYLIAALGSLCLLPPLIKWYRLRRGRTLQISIRRGPEFDERTPSRGAGIMHMCKARISSHSDKIIANARIILVDLVPAHQGEQAFLLKDNVTLAPDESITVSIASHVEGAPESAGLMSLQLPVFTGFYMSAGRGILTEEHHFQHSPRTRECGTCRETLSLIPEPNQCYASDRIDMMTSCHLAVS